MTYCCGILVREGLLMMADTRTNAGLDNISTFRKLHLFESQGEYAMMLATAGNLSVSQNVLNLINEGVENPETKEKERLVDMPSMFEAAHLIGRAIRKVRKMHVDAIKDSEISFSVSFLFGGQIKDRRLRLFMIYSAGNFIECTQDAPFFQIGEFKYGKPVLDRAISYETDIDDAMKVGLISMDSTMRSNLSVGMPIDVAATRRDSQTISINTRIDNTDPYFHDLRDRWSTALRAAHLAIPKPPYGKVRE